MGDVTIISVIFFQLLKSWKFLSIYFSHLASKYDAD